jgi:hypothetical protein
MRSLARAVIAAGVLAVAVGVAGCGSNGSLLSQEAATQLSSDLTQASSALNQYNCTAASSALTNFRDDVSSLQGVNHTLVTMLSQGASTITALAQERCPTSRVTTTATDTTTTATDTTTTDTTGGEPLGTVTTAPTPTVTPPPTPTTPDSGGAGINGSTLPSGGTGVGGNTP